MTDLAIRNDQEVVGPEPTLAELAATANREHLEASEAAYSSLLHAICAGEALLQARKHVDRGDWIDWLGSNFHASHVTASAYMRFAFYKERLDVQKMSIKEAKGSLAFLPDVSRRGARKYDDDVTAECRHLREKGLTFREIGELVGISDSTVAIRLNPGRAARHRETTRRWRAQQRAARQALHEKTGEAAVKRKGGTTATAYGQVRKALQNLQRAHDETVERDVKAAVKDAMHLLHQAEEAIVKASKLS